HRNSQLVIPLLRKPDQEESQILRETLGDFLLTDGDFEPIEYRPRTLKEVLAKIIPEASLSSIPKSLDIIGHIAITEIPPHLEYAKSEIGKAVLSIHRNVRTVLAKSGPVEGELRLRKYELIAGEACTETTHREYGCVYLLDPTKVYFSPRLCTERMRVAHKVSAGELVLDMFAGVGPFSILIARIQPKAKVYAIELNPVAAAYLTKNITLNHLDNRVFPIVGDARQVVESGNLPKMDRIIMNLPEKALEFLPSACKVIGKCGVIHYYTFKGGAEALKEAVVEAISALKVQGKNATVETARIVRETAPREWQIVVDLQVA
ncbi:MAG: class I SAM-dependent methyltransferase family protein, partial [Candidatus Bathyarchaeia archaeon]